MLEIAGNKMETGQKRSSSRNLPIHNWVDSTTRNMVINQVVFEEYIKSVLGKYRRWATKAQARLAQYGIDLTTTTIQNHYRALRSGKRKPAAASSFSGKPFDNRLIARYGKDLVYSKFELMVDMFVEDGTNYVGLPASQILMAARNYDSVDACERSTDMMAFMFMLKRHFAPAASVSFHAEDIFDFLGETDKKFSVYDFDLMCVITNGLLDQITEAIHNTSQTVSVINVTTCGGRKITEFQYDMLMPDPLFGRLEKLKWRILSAHSEKYVDSVMPMRSELFVLERR